MKGIRGWVRSESGDDGTSRHTHSASGRVMLEASSSLNKEDKAENDGGKQTEEVPADKARRILLLATPKISDMTWRFTPKIVIAAVRGNIAMAKDALTSSAGAVDAAATANVLDGLVSYYVAVLQLVYVC